MRVFKKVICIFIIITLLLNITGCTAYIDINDLPLILGLAIDKEDNNKYLLTTEVFKPTAPLRGKESQITTEILQAEGVTIFDAVRDLIIKLGKRGYWTHLKVMIISKDIAKEGLAPVLDFLSRNAHIREQFPVLISNDKTANEIFQRGKQTINEPVSIFINNTIRSIEEISKYEYVRFYELINNITNEGQNAVLPLVTMNTVTGKSIPSVYGTAIFKKDIMVGILNPDESKTLRLLKNKEKGGLIVVQWAENNEIEKVTLEVFKSKVNIKPLVKDDEININIKTTTMTEISEIMNPRIDVLSEKGMEKLREEAEKKIMKDIEKLLYKLQHELKSDPVGFGRKIKEETPTSWKKYEKTWPEAFETAIFNISSDVKFKGTASLAEELKIKE